MADEDPLIKALPPATDYLTYLTILEYQLTPARLPLLHNILQDDKLTANIGWDLLHLLLPLLPASEECLQDVAKLGNPREVILKVTESLVEIRKNKIEGYENLDDIQEDDDGDADPEHLESGTEESSKLGPAIAVIEEDNGARIRDTLSVRAASLSLPALQFMCLLSMLSVLHPRIKTKYPSRFLATSLRSILSAYPHVSSPATTGAGLEFVRTLSGRKRPAPPPRLNSKEISNFSSDDAAPDPEGQAEPPAPEEAAIQNRLLQSFLTHILEEYVISFEQGDVPGLACTARLQERLGSAKIVPGRKTYTQRFTEEEGLKERDAMVGQITALCRDLRIDTAELLESLTDPSKVDADLGDSNSFPSTPSGIPLSQSGSLLLLTARVFSFIIFQTPSQFAIPPLPIFPTHAALIKTFIGASTISSIGTEPSSAIDSILMLGFFALHNDQIGTPETHEEFTEYLQILSALSANTPDPDQRYNAHRLTSAVLHSHSSPSVRLEFIRDTLEHCPFDNLKGSAVGWLKTEILAAIQNNTVGTSKMEQPLFLQPPTLAALVPLLFPPLASSLLTPPLPLAWESFQSNLNFHLATLNLLYLLISSPSLASTLQVVEAYRDQKVGERFTDVLIEATKNFQGFLTGEWGEGVLVGTEGYEGIGRGIGELELVKEVTERVEASLKRAEP